MWHCITELTKTLIWHIIFLGDSMLIHDMRHDFPKNAGYLLDRPYGRNYYIFAHYYAPVELKLGDHSFQVQPGGCVLIPPGTPQHLYSPEPLIHNWIHFECDPEALQAYQLPFNEPFYIPNHALLSNMVRQMEQEFFSHDPHREMMLYCSMHRLLIWLDRSLHTSAGVSVSKSLAQAMGALRKNIFLHPEQDQSVGQMAKTVSLSTSRFHAVYKALFGTTPTQDLICARIENAKNLLLTRPEISIREAASLLGYNDQYHFIRQFKTVTNQTPGAYRKAHIEPF